VERTPAERRGAGVSLATPVYGDPDRTPYVEPSAMARASYDDRTKRIAAVFSYQYDAALPRLGSGPTFRGQLTAFGIPYDHGAWRELNVFASASGERSVTRTIYSSELETKSLAATAAARWGFGPHWGVLAGLDVRSARFDGEALVPVPFDRTLVFVGASWFETNGRDERTLVPFGDLPF